MLGLGCAPFTESEFEPEPESKSEPDPQLPGPGPVALSYGGAVVHPACLTATVVENTRRVSLARCRPDDPVAREDGWVTSAPLDPEDGREFDGYTVLGLAGDEVVVHYMFNGGGTGYFSGIATLAIEDDELVRHEHLLQGDRCNGGVQEAHLEGETVDFTVSITPYDLLGLVEEGRALGLEAYVDLEASATSCIGEARFRHSLASGVGRFESVMFADGVLVDSPGWTGKYRHQSCFNALVEGYQQRDVRELGPAELRTLVAAFEAKCVEGR